MREKGVVVNDVPKIQLEDPDESNHSLEFPETKLRIPLKLWGIFSYLPTRRPMVDELQELEEIYLLTPTQFNAHEPAYAANEDNMVDWEGCMIEKQHRSKVIMTDLMDDAELEVSMSVSSVEGLHVSLTITRLAEEQETE